MRTTLNTFAQRFEGKEIAKDNRIYPYNTFSLWSEA